MHARRNAARGDSTLRATRSSSQSMSTSKSTLSGVRVDNHKIQCKTIMICLICLQASPGGREQRGVNREDDGEEQTHLTWAPLRSC